VEAEPQKPLNFLDDGLRPRCYAVDGCVAIPIDPTTLFAYWEVREATLARLRQRRSDGVVALRAFTVTADWNGPRSSTRDIDVREPVGEWIIRDLPAGAVVRVAVGWRTGEVFLPVAHSPALETPYGGPGPMLAELVLRWTSDGPASVSPRDKDYGVIGRALDRLHASSASHSGEGGESETRATGDGRADTPTVRSEHAHA
jgi:hypothetical protein